MMFAYTISYFFQSLIAMLVVDAILKSRTLVSLWLDKPGNSITRFSLCS